jgi:glycosyltransferase XagB
MRIGEYLPLYPEKIALNRLSVGKDADSWFTALPARLQEEAVIIARLGLGKPLVLRMAEQAEKNGTSIESELLVSRSVAPDAYYEALARHLGLPFMSSIDPREVTDYSDLDSQLAKPLLLRLNRKAKGPHIVLVPEAGRLPALRSRLEHGRTLRDYFAIATPTAVRQAVWSAGRKRRVRDCINSLYDKMPAMSARSGLSGFQGFLVGFCLSLLFFGLVTHTLDTALLVHIAASFFYCGILALRALALRHSPQPATLALALKDEALPVYTILVALYKESAVAAQLVKHLDALAWPRSKLDIKLVCEADDLETRRSLQELSLGPEYEIVDVPPSRPRTKPKALAYALSAARGPLMVLFDAEDRPHPNQLREAFAAFCNGGDDLACVQAPLRITNDERSWISRMFALEYAGLFGRILPMLAEKRMPMPLGGTSNHFRTDVLRQVGGWDPHNVTEDADLGMRLYRAGYHCGMISLPTLEDAPTRISDWVGQRTRWFKGWMQTIVVHCRHPRRLARDMGWSATVLFLLLMVGIVVSALAHPLLLVFLVQTAVAAMSDKTDMLHQILSVMDIANIFLSYVIFVWLGMTAPTMRANTRPGRWLFMVPVYWLMLSWAAWQALIELKTNPFYWKKTEHRPT